METDAGPGCAPADEDSAVLLAEFRMWLDRERGLSPVSVRCYSKQAKAFLAADRRAGSGERAGRGQGHCVHGGRTPGTAIPGRRRRW